MTNVVFSVCAAAALLLGFIASEARAQYWVTVQNDLDGRCLEADPGVAPNTEGARVRMWDCNGSAHQRWFVDAPAGSSTIAFATLRNGHSNTCLLSSYTGQWDIFAGLPPRDPNGTEVTLSKCNPNNTGYLWRIWSDYAMLSRDDTTMILDYNPGTRGNGGQVYLWSAAQVPPAQQRWKLNRVDAPTAPKPPVTPPPPPPARTSLDHIYTVVCQCWPSGVAAAESFCLRDSTANDTAKVLCARACCGGDSCAAGLGATWGFRGQPTTPCNLHVKRDAERWFDTEPLPEGAPTTDALTPLADELAK